MNVTALPEDSTSADVRARADAAAIADLNAFFDNGKRTHLNILSKLGPVRNYRS